MTEDWQNGGFGLYIHWPFCEAKCPYCDFNSHVVRQIDQAAWRDAYLVELRRAAAETRGRVLRSVFFGGGTPSLMDPDTVADVIREIRALWPVANDLEITLEANPSSVEAGRFAAFREGGITRISMGIQALNDDDLRRLGRIHESRHNLIYWRHGDYLGIGPGAHGRLTADRQRWATECHSNPNRWLSSVSRKDAEKPRAALTLQDQASEFLLMGLRLKEGIDKNRYEALSGKPLDANAISDLVNLGMISDSENRLVVLDQGFIVLNAVVSRLLEG